MRTCSTQEADTLLNSAFCSTGSIRLLVREAEAQTVSGEKFSSAVREYCLLEFLFLSGMFAQSARIQPRIGPTIRSVFMRRTTFEPQIVSPSTLDYAMSSTRARQS